MGFFKELSGSESLGDEIMSFMPSLEQLNSSREFYEVKTSGRNDRVVTYGQIMLYADLVAVNGKFSAIASAASGKALNGVELRKVFDTYVVKVVSKFVVYDLNASKLSVRDNDGSWRVLAENIPPISVDSLSRLLAMLFDVVFAPLDTESKKCAQMLLDAIEQNVVVDVDRIQFDDAIMTPRGVEELESAFNNTPPAFTSPRRLRYSAPSRRVRAVDELLSHVARDDSTRERLLDKLSMPLILDETLRAKTQGFVFLYGSGGTGKSTLLDLVERAYGSEEMSASVNLSKFDGFSLEKVIGKLVLIDTDCSNGFIEAGPSDNLKKLVSGEKLSINRKHLREITYRAKATLFAAGNDLPRSADKSTGWLRRLELYSVDTQLVKDDDWWAELKSDDAAQYMFEILLAHALAIIETRRLAPVSDEMTKLLESYVQANDSVAAWLEDGIEKADILHKRPKDVYAEYEQWCEMNKEPVCGKHAFIARMKTALGVIVAGRGVTAADALYTTIVMERSGRGRQTGDRVIVRVFVDRSEAKSEMGV